MLFSRGILAEIVMVLNTLIDKYTCSIADHRLF